MRRKIKKVLAISEIIMYYIQVPTIVGLDKAPSPNGKATDSDSVIFKVRILVALLKELTGQFLFCYLEKVL